LLYFEYQVAVTAYLPPKASPVAFLLEESLVLSQLAFLAREGVAAFFGKIFGIGFTAIFGFIIGLILIALLETGFDRSDVVVASKSLFAFLSWDS